jgi:DNA polymerase III alpha subunit (gram-positive type)
MPAKGKWVSPKLWRDIKETLKGQKFVTVLDVETTGLSPANDRIIEFAAIRFALGDGFEFRETDSMNTYINPGCPVPSKITELTGITDETVSGAPSESEAIIDILDFLGRGVFCGYNARKFDMKFILETANRNGEPFVANKIIDTMEMAKNLIDIDKESGPENYKLKTIGDYFGVKFDAHSAFEDVRATAEITKILLSEYAAREKESDGSAETGAAGRLKPEVKKVSFWEGFKGRSRIYVETSEGSVYYDIREGRWGGKDTDVSTLDMEHVEVCAFGLTGCKTEDEFKKFKGSIKNSAKAS